MDKTSHQHPRNRADGTAGVPQYLHPDTDPDMFGSTSSSARNPTDSTQVETGNKVSLGVFLKQDLAHKPDFSLCV